MVLDQINTPLERAVWWLEYAMRYPGMKHMRSPVHDLHWTQYFMLDILAFVFVVSSLFVWIVYKICKCCCCRKKKLKLE